MSIGYYEVFLNFRGRDTRTGFTDHLYYGLVDAGISVFKDDNELRQGEKIGPDLLTAIGNSKILIPIISVNYGQSRWCLDELVQIMECKKSNMGYTVLPIFYKVEPSDVRFQKGSFGDAFCTRIKNSDSTTLEKWKQALDEVSSLKGFDANGYEGKLVKSVVQQVLFELKKKFELFIPENLVGIDSHVKKVMEFVDNISRASLFVGIHGMGGIGKTTLAKTIYNKLSNQFEHRSFIADERKPCDDKRLVSLQNQLIKDILKLENQVSNKDEGIQFISSKFNGKKVLILLDDVSNDDQLKALAGNHNWFSLGSVIIITTRNRSILDNARVDNHYEHEVLNMDNSLILFSRHAIRRDFPPNEFKDLTHDVVSTTGGLPLSLEVLGSFLCGKKEKVWRDTIKKLRKFPHEEVQKKLRISYEELTHEQKQIFLDIACCFIGIDKRTASYMWDACGFFPEEGIEVLRFLSLIKVGDDHELIMHDQLRDLSREIVRKENNLEPWNRSRLWDYEEVLEVLEGNKGTSKIETLYLNLYNGRGSYTAETFKELTNLRFLQLNNVNLTGDCQNLLPRLRWLEWDGYHWDFELSNFHLKKLVILSLSASKISKDWGGFGPLKMATKLKVLYLWNCALRTTPDLSAFKSLEILILEDCEGVEEIHPSIEDIKTLVTLDINGCQKLKELPLGVGRMQELRDLLIYNTDIQEIPISRGCLTKLETLHASNCTLLARLPKSLGSLMSLTELHLSNTGIEKLPESIGFLKKLETLNASYCASLARIPNSIGDLAFLSQLDLRECKKLAQLPDSIGSLVSLSWLSLSGCYLLRQIPDWIGKLTSLTELHLKSMAIEELPESIGSLKKLETIDASYCASLHCIPNSIGDLASLSQLDLRECHKLAQLPDSIGSLVCLSQLLLSECHSLREIPNSIGKLTSLTELRLKSMAIEELLESIGSLKKVETLDASYCASLARMPNSIGDVESLSRLDLRECHKLAQLPDSIDSLVSLSWLSLSGCYLLRQIPDWIGKLTSLTKLHLEFMAIEELPESIGSLKKLETLDASYCASLARMPNSIGDLVSLSQLNLTECKKLAQLPDSIDSLVSLSWLSLLGCYLLRQIPDWIGKLTSLTKLHLESMAIEELPESIGFLKKLETLDASYCASLARIPNSIGDLASLSQLDLRECKKLAELPNSICSLVSLSWLSLSGCYSLRQIPNSIEKLTSLTMLHLKSTAIEELPESIRNMQNLRMLDICETPIVELLDDRGILAEVQGLRALGWKNLEGPASNNGQLVSPNNLDLDKRQKLSELHSRVLPLVLLKRPKTHPINNSAVDYQTTDSEHVSKRSKPFGISYEDSESMADEKPRIADDSADRSRNWKPTEINEPSQCRSIRLPDNSTATRVSRLIYTNSGGAILALSSNAVHKLWKWVISGWNSTARATTRVVPQLWQPPSGNLMTNDTSGINPEDTVSCFALSKNDCYLFSASGGEISLFNLMTFKVMTTIMPQPPYGDIIAIGMDDSSIQIYSGQEDEVKTKLKGHRRIIKGFSFPTSLTVLVSYGADSQTITTLGPPPAATFLACHPQDNNIIAIGMEDSSIQIYNVRIGGVMATLRGHQKRITSLAFSHVLNVLVSSGADSLLCVWSTDGWEKQASKFLQMPNGRGPCPLADTRVQFHVDQVHLLVVHQTQIATYEAPRLELLKQWDTREASAPITDAAYSCNGQSIYVSFEDGSIGVLIAPTLRMRCVINPAAYIPPTPSLKVYPIVIAAHPSEPNQFALGLTNGSVYVLEPLESEGKWGTSPLSGASAIKSDQPQR